MRARKYRRPENPKAAAASPRLSNCRLLREEISRHFAGIDLRVPNRRCRLPYRIAIDRSALRRFHRIAGPERNATRRGGHLIRNAPANRRSRCRHWTQSDADDAAEASGDVVFHAGTRIGAAGLETSGGRVLGVTARGRDLREAVRNAYSAVKQIHFDGMHYRKDIGRSGIARGQP